MSISLYDITIAPFIRSLNNLSGILKKGEAYADEQGIAHDKLLEARLVADMKPLTFQIQRASDTSKMSAVRIGGVESVSMADDETTFAQLQARVQKTIDFLEAVPKASIDGKEDAHIVFFDMPFTGLSYATVYAMPNFYFHVTAAYAILRHMGVPVGKWDFLGKRE